MGKGLEEGPLYRTIETNPGAGGKWGERMAAPRKLVDAQDSRPSSGCGDDGHLLGPWRTPAGEDVGRLGAGRSLASVATSRLGGEAGAAGATGRMCHGSFLSRNSLIFANIMFLCCLEISYDIHWVGVGARQWGWKEASLRWHKWRGGVTGRNCLQRCRWDGEAPGE